MIWIFSKMQVDIIFLYASFKMGVIENIQLLI